MVAWWTGDNTTADLTGYGHDLDWFHLATQKAYTAGKVGNAFSLSTGLAAPYELLDTFFSDSCLNLDGNLSIDAWIRTTNSSYPGIVSAGGRYFLFLLNGHLGFAFGDGDPTQYVSAGPGLSDNSWHHVAVTVDRSSSTGGKLYADGALVLTFDPQAGASSPPPPFVDIRIGGAFVSGELFLGAIDEVELFDRALSQSEVAALAGSGSSGKCKTPPPTRTASPTQTRTRTSSPTSSPTAPPTTTSTPTPPCSAELCVFKFNDLNGNGVHDSGEPNLAGWTIHVTDPNMNIVANMATGAQGSFCIGVPAPVAYTVSEVPQNGWTQTFPPAPGSHIFTIQCGQLVNVEFGNAEDATRTPTCTLTRTATATATATRTPTRTSNIPID